MAIFELWLERSPDNKYTSHFDRVPAEKGKPAYASKPLDSATAAAQALRENLRSAMSVNDQMRVRDRISIYENVNDALEDMLRS